MPIDPYRSLDFATRQIIKVWVEREARSARPIPWAGLSKPLADRTVALASGKIPGGAARPTEPSRALWARAPMR